MKAFRFPPDLWEDVERYIPKGERTAILVECLRRHVAKRKKALPPAPEEGAPE